MVATPPSLPEAGLRRIAGSWSGMGTLVHALAGLEEDPETGRAWTEAQIERRAYRILFEAAKPAVRRLPVRSSRWLDVLPVVTQTLRTAAPSPFPGARWAETQRRAGWPPTLIWGRARRRTDDSLLVSGLRWILDRLLSVAGRVEDISPVTTLDVPRQLDAARAALAMEPLASASPERPSRVELSAMRGEGPPWSAAADVGATLLLAEGPTEEFAFRLLAPEAALRPLLFHLGVMGAVLQALEAAGAAVVSLRPLGAGGKGPAYRATRDDIQWDIWFEAGGAWAYYDVEEPYREATSAMPIAYQPLGADVMLIVPHERAVVIECKYPITGDASYIARHGYHQALTYAVEARLLAERISAIVVGPETLTGFGRAETAAGSIAFAPPTALPGLIQEILDEN